MSISISSSTTTKNIFDVPSKKNWLSITNSSLIFDKQPSTWSHSTLLDSLKDCTHWKMKKTMQKLENLRTIRRRWSQLEVKLFTEKLKRKWRNWINSSKHSIASIIFSLLSSSPLFPLFIGQKKKKRQVLTNEEKHFLWRHSLLDPTSVTEVDIAFSHPLRHQFIGQHFLVNKISS